MNQLFSINSTLDNEKMNHQFVPHVWVKQFLNEEEISRILNLWDKDKIERAKISDQPILNGKIRQSTIQFIDSKESPWIYEKLMRLGRMINAAKYQFELSGFQSKLQLTEYQPDDFYHWHADIGKGAASIRKLSITVQLSAPSDYLGGELQFMDADNYLNAPKEQGTAIIFPSYTAHRVLPVTSGYRRAIVGWIAGPPYR